MAKRGAEKRRKQEDDPVSRLAFVLLRYFRGWWDKVRLVAAGGFLSSQVTMWDHGDRPVPWPALQRTADVTGFPRYLLGPMLRVLRSFLLAAKGRSRPRRALAEVSVAELFPLAVSALDLILEPLDGPAAEEARENADALFERLKERPERQRWLLVENVLEFRQGPLVPKLVEESLRLAPNHPRESLGWAKLAVRLSDLVGSGKSHAWAALTNAHRVCNDLPAAREARARARQLWEAGEPGDPGLLNKALLPWIEAALHRAERNFPLALQRIGEALELDNGELRGKILLTKAYIHNTLDEPEASTAAILEASPIIDAEREPRLALIVLQNLIGDLVHLGRIEEARARLPEARRLAEQLGGELDLSRVLGMEARVAAALGNLDEARERFERVRSAFDKPELIYDHALVTLELSAVLLELGETAQVRTLADDMLRIFRSQQVLPESLAALRVFCEAARKETATVELVRQVVRQLYRAKGGPAAGTDAGTTD